MTERVKPDTREPIPPQFCKGQWSITGWQLVEGGEVIQGDNVPVDAVSIWYANGWIFDFILLRLNNPTPWRHKED